MAGLPQGAITTFFPECNLIATSDCRWGSVELEFFGAMKTAQIKEIVERIPFRPFAVRLSNGARYEIHSPRNVGAPESYNVIFYFGPNDTWALIDTENIVEITNVA